MHKVNYQLVYTEIFSEEVGNVTILQWIRTLRGRTFIIVQNQKVNAPDIQ